MKVFKKICDIFSTVIIAVFAVVAVLLIGPMLFGCKNMAVISGSMEPDIPVGSVVCVKETDPSELTEGDVITYAMSGSTMVTHRIVSIDKENRQIITKGDANDVEDGTPVTFDNVVGKEIFHIPLLGYLSIYIKTPLGIMVICGVLILLILLNFLPSILESDGKNKNKDVPV